MIFNFPKRVALVICFLILLLGVNALSAKPEGIWRSKGYYSLLGKPSGDNCNHFLSFKETGKIKWLALTQLINMENGDLKVSTHIDTTQLLGLFPLENGYLFRIEDREYTIEIRSETEIWVVAKKYKIKFEPLTTLPESPIHVDSLKSKLIGKPFEYSDGKTIYGLQFDSDTTMLFQHNYNAPFKGVWELVEFEGLYFAFAQASAPILIMSIGNGKIYCLSLDFRYPPQKSVFRPTTVFFREKNKDE